MLSPVGQAFGTSDDSSILKTISDSVSGHFFNSLQYSFLVPLIFLFLLHGLQVVTADDNSYLDLLSSFTELTSPTSTSEAPGHGVYHHIPNTGHPVIPGPVLCVQTRYVLLSLTLCMKKMGTIHPSGSQRVLPLHMAPKPISELPVESGFCSWLIFGSLHAEFCLLVGWYEDFLEEWPHPGLPLSPCSSRWHL